MKNLSNSNRILVWIAIAIGVALIVAAIFNTSATTSYGADTPEGVVQRYLDASLDGAPEEADQYLTQSLRDDCIDDEFMRFGPKQDGARVALLASDIDGATARVTVRVTEGSFELFGSSEWTHEELYVLEQSNGGWLINHQTWPRYGC